MSAAGAEGASGSAAGAEAGARRALPDGDARRLRRAAEELEGLFVTQLLRASGVAGGGTFARVPGAGVMQGLAEEAFGRALADQADFGLADTIVRELSGGTSSPPWHSARFSLGSGLESVSGGWREPETSTGAQRAERANDPGGAVASRASTGRGGERQDPPDSTPRVPAERHDPPDAPLARFAAEIREAAERFGVDPDLIRAVILQESGGDPRARSRKGARGLMQILDGTARELGLRRPFDPRENILAGTRYLADLLERNGGDLALALASYNAGPGAVARHGGIPPYRETLRYVAGVLSLHETLRAQRDPTVAP